MLQPPWRRGLDVPLKSTRVKARASAQRACQGGSRSSSGETAALPRGCLPRDTRVVDLGISGRVALVGGATQGIGRAVAETLVAEGARVVVTAREEGRTADVAAEIGAEAGLAWNSGDVG